MSQKNHWTEQQDQILRSLKEDRNIEKWSQISQVMKQQYNIDDRSGKQCRERYTNHLDSAISKKQWSKQEDQMVYKLHNEYGNKWAIIADHLQGRTDNCIKNHFYSRLRKGLRKINKTIEDEYKKQFKQFKIIDLYKVIEASDQKFKEVKTLTNQMADIGLELKNRLFVYAEQQNQETVEYKHKIKRLLQDFTEFTKNYKRKSKKSRRYSPMGVDSVYRVNNIKKNNLPHTEDGEQDIEKIQEESEEKQQDQLKSQKNNGLVVKIQQDFDRKQQKVPMRQKRQKSRKSNSEYEKQKDTEKQKMKTKQIQKVFVQPLIFKKQIPMQIFEQTNVRKSTKRNKDFRHFSDDQDQQKNEAQYVKQQRLNHFAENILKTFKSYYSFQSFKSNSVMQEPFFQ